MTKIQAIEKVMNIRNSNYKIMPVCMVYGSKRYDITYNGLRIVSLRGIKQVEAFMFGVMCEQYLWSYSQTIQEYHRVLYGEKK